ncbi:trimeric intracellular cation channel type B [Dromiciops gliroides]|uniref:trimeric intracellular cation channel type B n=1 Tax=Dromiciops gliroides TaxID=33562 RepID=UPI001CC6A390|nr:trimeric intracellular cation channel type B [Dromiciops gliroides]
MERVWEELTLAFSRISMFPFFDIAHYLVSVMTLRQQLGAVTVAWQNPLASWFSAMLYCFGGGILSCILLGEAPTKFLENSTNVLLASSIWYIVFYCPYDIVCECYCFPPVQLMAVGMKEVTRTWKITGGITHASSNYTDAWMVLVAIGWARGAGGNVIISLEQLLRGTWKPETGKLLEMSYPVKITLVGAVLFTLQHAEKLPMEKHSLMFCYTFFIVFTKITMMLTECNSSPLTPFEIILGRLLFGLRQHEASALLRNTLKSSFNGTSTSSKPGSTSNENKKKHNKKTE